MTEQAPSLVVRTQGQAQFGQQQHSRYLVCADCRINEHELAYGDKSLPRQRLPKVGNVSALQQQQQQQHCTSKHAGLQAVSCCVLCCLWHAAACMQHLAGVTGRKSL
jgi:hypothetical protein